MIPIGTVIQHKSASVQEAADIVASTDRSAEKLERLQALWDGATGDDKEKIGYYIEGFLVDDGISL